MSYTKESIEKYINDLGAKLPAPGGGSASAVCGTLGIALILMVSNFTIGKEKYSAYQGEIEDLIAKAEFLKKRLLDYMDRDVEAYKDFSKVYEIPKEKRAPALQKALKQALYVPMEICRTAYEAIQLTTPLITKGNQNLISDVGVAASMLYSAFESAKINVNVNLKDIEDLSFVNEVSRELDVLSVKVKQIAHEVLAEVDKKVRPRKG